MEKNFYDTNILIDFVREKQFEIIGYTSILNIIEFPKAIALKNLDVIFPNMEDYLLSVFLSKKLLKMGTPIPAVDILIASIAINHKLPFVTRDQHFKVIKVIEPSFKLIFVQDHKPDK